MVNISIVSVHCVKNDAISNVMKTYSDWIREEVGYVVKCYGYHTEYTQDELPFQQLENAGQLLLDKHFQSSAVVIFQFGIYFSWMDLIGLVPSHAKTLVIFHDITPKVFVPQERHSLIDKSIAQVHNLKLADYVTCDSATNLNGLRAYGIQTPALVLPLWFNKIYGTPRYKPSFYDQITRIVFLGRFVRSKNGLDLLSALERHLSQTRQTGNAKPLQLTVICDQEHSDEVLLKEAQVRAAALEAACEGLLKIDFVFNASDPVKFQVLQDADIFALANYHEGFCVPTLEALSNSCRVVAYKNSNVPFVAGADAHLAETGDVTSLTEHLGAAISIVNDATWWAGNDAEYLRFTDRCREHLSQFSAGKARHRFLNLLHILSKPQEILCNDLYLLGMPGFVLPEQKQLVRLKGLNVVGFLSGILGLGEAARAMLHGLNLKHQNTWPLELIDLYLPQLPLARDKTFQNFESEFKYAINLIMLNPSEHDYAARHYGLSKFQGRYNIGLWYWELVDVIPEWRNGAKLIDELWVTTDYIRDNMVQFTHVPVHKVTIPIVMEMSKINKDRKAFDLPENTFLFVFAFDHNSIMSRKNPMAVINAYSLAFGNRKDVGLVVKTINSDKQPERQAELREAIKDLNAFIIDGEMERYESFSLYAACDSYVSLHRAEGLGLAMAECMYMGKPVIATGYSGNMEFMNHDNSMPVRYNMVQIQEDQSAYRKGRWWAEPDIEHAVECMLALVNDLDLCKTMGERAAKHIQTHFSLEKAHQSMYKRLDEIAKDQSMVLGFVP